MLRVTQRVYRTVDGDLVEEGDPRAAFLAYAVGDEVPDDVARRDGLPGFLAAKAKPRPADKAVHRVDDKAGRSLTTTNRVNRKEQPDG